MGSQRTPKEDLLIAGLDDWIYAGWVLVSAELSGETDPIALRTLALDLINDVLTSGLMVAGEVTSDGHVPYSLSAEDSAAQIANEWIAEWGAEVPAPGAITWLDNTSAGDAMARAVLARESEGGRADES